MLRRKTFKPFAPIFTVGNNVPCRWYPPQHLLESTFDVCSQTKPSHQRSCGPSHRVIPLVQSGVVVVVVCDSHENRSRYLVPTFLPGTQYDLLREGILRGRGWILRTAVTCTVTHNTRAAGKLYGNDLSADYNPFHDGVRDKSLVEIRTKNGQDSQTHRREWYKIVVAALLAPKQKQKR